MLLIMKEERRSRNLHDRFTQRPRKTAFKNFYSYLAPNFFKTLPYEIKKMKIIGPILFFEKCEEFFV